VLYRIVDDGNAVNGFTGDATVDARKQALPTSGESEHVERPTVDNSSRSEDAPHRARNASCSVLRVRDVRVPLVRVAQDEPRQPVEGDLRLAVLGRRREHQAVTAADPCLDAPRVGSEVGCSSKVWTNPHHEVKDGLGP